MTDWESDTCKCYILNYIDTPSFKRKCTKHDTPAQAISYNQLINIAANRKFGLETKEQRLKIMEHKAKLYKESNEE